MIKAKINLVEDGNAASPEDIGRKLWQALALFVCEKQATLNPQHTTDKLPCMACMKLIWPLVTPVAKALAISGRRNGQFYLTGKAVLWLLEYAMTGEAPEDFNDEDEE